MREIVTFIQAYFAVNVHGALTALTDTDLEARSC
jgi:hypothetical protein